MSESSIRRDHADQRFASRPQSARRRKLADYYRAVVGLEELSRSDGAITLGAADRPLLVIEADPSAKPDDPRSAGLFHTAFLLPSRADLGRWVKHAIDKQIPIEAPPTIWSARRSI